MLIFWNRCSSRLGCSRIWWWPGNGKRCSVDGYCIHTHIPLEWGHAQEISQDWGYWVQKCHSSGTYVRSVFNFTLTQHLIMDYICCFCWSKSCHAFIQTLLSISPGQWQDNLCYNRGSHKVCCQQSNQWWKSGGRLREGMLPHGCSRASEWLAGAPATHPI